MTDTLVIPRRWEDVTPSWMTAAIGGHHPGAEVADVALLLRDDGTNRRARFGLTYAVGSGPTTVFAKAESDARGRRQIHARNGNLFNEPLLFNSGASLPVEHPLVYAAVIDEPGLDYLVLMEDLLARGADPRDATRPLTVDQVARGIRGLARLHSRYWNNVQDHAALDWVQPFVPVEGWQAPMKLSVPKGLERAAAVIPGEVQRRSGEELVGDIWARGVGTLTMGSQTLLHGDPHIGNTYLLSDGEVGFLDWQVVRRGNWSHDVGYFIQSALTPEDRRASEVDLVEEYRRSLEIPDPDRPTAEEAWTRYRVSPAHGLVVWLATASGDVHSREICLALIERYAAAFVELDTPGALDALGV
jgi:sulfur transfer complex TusBCD TusB component (DsrH family)